MASYNSATRARKSPPARGDASAISDNAQSLLDAEADLPDGLHVHNDFGIATAMALASLENGAEVWLRKGSTLNAVRASLACAAPQAGPTQM